MLNEEIGGGGSFWGSSDGGRPELEGTGYTGSVAVDMVSYNPKL